MECLAKNIYYEARGEPFQGQLAVAKVTINRTLHPTQFGRSICSTVYAKKQFSWTIKRQKPPKGPEWESSKIIAEAAMMGHLRLDDFNATYYHADYVKPKWAAKLSHIGSIGSHLFYK